MPEDIYSILTNPLILVLIFAIIIFLVYMRLKGKGKKPEDFKPQPQKVTIGKEMKEKMKMMGTKIPRKTFLIRDFNKIARVDRYARVESKVPKYYFDEKNNNQFKTTNETINMKLVVFRSPNKFFILRWLGMKTSFYLFDILDEERLFHYDHISKSIIIQGYIDITRYANVWVISESGYEYLHNLSIKRMVEQTNMWLENNPDRTVHLDVNQAKIERTNRTIAEMERKKYEERKDIGESTIT